MDLTPIKADVPSQAAPSSTGDREVLYWQAPMDPTYIREEPGKSPMGMDLVPVYSDEVDASTEAHVTIEPWVVQNMGVRIEPVRQQTVFRHLRTIGEVEVGEDELSVVNLRFSGWVEKLYVDRTGDPVRRGQVLFDIYSPDLVSSQEEYLLALRTQGPDSVLARSARRRLELWDLAERDIDVITASGEARRALPIRAPQSGFVLHKNLVEGGRVAAGKDLYRIGNLTRIWVTAEIYEHDSPWVEVGQPAQMELAHQPGVVLQGEVAYIYPTLEGKSRTLTVRLEFDNPGIRLKPGMFATVLIEFRRKDDVLAVPTEAILQTGRRELVFVSLGRGSFEPREITTGLVGDRHMTEVLTGLRDGEEVVVSGQFLIDSESQLQEAIRKMRKTRTAATSEEPAAREHTDTVWSCPMHPEVLSDGEGRCPECGMDLEQRPGTPDELAEVHAPATAQPGQYTCPMHPEVISDDPGRCPECGMFLEQVPEDVTDAADMHAGHDHGGAP
jgi:Cu(I)/Ag(I) efflux system membrane fusion protein/cobalt-zinc-cadmium efflux system membrane fusion protein